MVVFGQARRRRLHRLHRTLYGSCLINKLVCHAASCDNHLSSVQDYILDSKLLGLSVTKLFDRVVSILLLFHSMLEFQYVNTLKRCDIIQLGISEQKDTGC